MLWESSTESILTRSLRGIGANAVSHAITAVSSIILVPVFLSTWGSQTYGEWLALSAAIGYLTLLDLGIQTYVVNRMSQAYAQNRLSDLHRDLHSSLRVFLAVAILGLAGLLMFVALAPLGAIFNLRVTGRGTAALTRFFRYAYERAVQRFFTNWLLALPWQRLPAYERLGKLLLTHLDGILACGHAKAPSRAVVAINGNLRTAL
jgi:hypothetical protein